MGLLTALLFNRATEGVEEEDVNREMGELIGPVYDPTEEFE